MRGDVTTYGAEAMQIGPRAYPGAVSVADRRAQQLQHVEELLEFDSLSDDAINVVALDAVTPYGTAAVGALSRARGSPESNGSRE